MGILGSGRIRIICHVPIFVGQQYTDGVGGTRVIKASIAHYSCVSPR